MENKLKENIEKLTPSECEILFQQTTDWDTKWYLVQFCCENMAKKLLKGIKMPPERLELRVGEAVMECMEKLKNGVQPNKLSSWTYWPVRRALQNGRAQQEDREMLSYESYTDNVLRKEEEGQIFEDGLPSNIIIEEF